MAKRPKVNVRLLLALLALGTAPFALFFATEVVYHPYAVSLGGRSTLTGEWLGELTTASGSRQVVWLDIERGGAAGTLFCRTCSDLDGRALTCEPGGAVRSYEIYGDVAERNGANFLLNVRVADSPELDSPELSPGQGGTANRQRDLRLGALDGTWSGEEMVVTTTLISLGDPATISTEKTDSGEETTTITGGDPDARDPVTFSLRTGSEEEFGRRCGGGN